MNAKIRDIRKKILPVLQRYGTKRAGLFGSCVRGDTHKTSDVDLLVEIGSDLSLLGFIRMKLDLEEVLGKPVDLVEYETIKPLLREVILREEVQIL